MSDPEPFQNALTSLTSQKSSSEEAARQYMLTHNIRPRLAACGWEARFRSGDVTLSPAQKLAIRDATALLRSKGAIVALVGERGLGKTTIAASIAMERTWHFWDYYQTMPENREGMTAPQGIPVYRKMAQIVATFKPLYADFGSIDTESLLMAKERLCDESLLVIDELHECEEMKAKDRILTDIVDIRYARRRDTILISNQTEQEFKASTNSSVISRLSEHGKVIVCKWKSFREVRP
jgi:DNA replication protein DnaC